MDQAAALGSGGSSFTARAIGVLKLKRATFREVALDRGATAQAAVIVALASISSGVSSVGDDGALGLILGAGAALIAWVVGSFFAWIAGDKLIPSKTTDAKVGNVMRALGWADVPMIFAAATLISGIGGLLGAVLWVLSFLTTLVALKVVFDCGTIRALFIALLSRIVYGATIFLIAAIVGITVLGVVALF